MRNLKFIFTLVFNAIILMSFAQDEVKSVTVEKLHSIVEKKSENDIILDVRTEQEYKESYIKGAQNLNFLASDIDESLKKLDRTKEYYVYCFSGSRSERTVQKMKKLGFLYVYNVTGGIRAWTEAGYGLEK